MKNNEYTATPNWFGDTTVSSLQPTSGQTNYYISSTVSGSGSTGGLQSINLYNKFVIKTLRLTIDDLVINDSALIAEDVELEEGLERPEDFVSEIGNIVTDKDWHTSYKFRIIAGTNLVANLKANDKRYGIVFYDNYNQPISGYSPKQDALETIVVPENTRYFRCCHYIEPVVESDESTEEPVEPKYEFYIEYRGFDNYDESDLNIAYGSIFEDFINVNQSIPEGIISDALTSTKLNLIFQQPLQYNIDKSGNIKIELDNDLLTNTLGNTYVTTIADNPQDILSQKDFKQGLKVNGINIIEKDGYVYLDGNLVLSGGVTTYSGDGLKVPGLYDGLPIDNITIYWEKDADGNKILKSRGGGGEGNVDMVKVWEELAANTSEQINESHLTTALSKYPTTSKMWELLKAGTTELINISHLTEALQSFSVSDDLKNKYVTLDETKLNILGIKNFVNGLELDGLLIKIVDGVLYLDCSVAITGGLTIFALGDRQPSTIMDAIVVDDTTISKEGGVLHLKNGAGGGGDIDENKLWLLLGSEGINQIHESHLTTALSSYATIEQLNKKWTQDDIKISHWDEAYGWGDHSKQGYAHLAGEEVFTGLKHFTPGITIGSGKHRLYESNGVVYLDGDLAVTGGVTAYAQGSRSVSTITDGVNIDNVTIKRNSSGQLYVDGDLTGGASSWDDITGKPIWITDDKPTYNWSEIKNTPTTLRGYGITDAFKIISGTPDTNKGMSAGYWNGIGSYASFVGNNWGGQFKMESTEALSYRTIKNGTASAWKNIAFTTSTIDNALHLNGKELNYNSKNPYGKIPFVMDDGVMEVGRYIDFHTDKNDDRDYAVRLQATNTTGGATVTLPSKAGTLALLTDNVESASKLATARKLWGQSFDGTKNISGNMSGVGTIQLDSSKNTIISPFTSDLTSSEAWYGLTFKWNSGNLNVCLNGYAGLSFKTSGGSMVMNSSGKVGIGNTSPAEKLDINGNVITSGIYKTYKNNAASWGATNMLAYSNANFSVSSQVAVGQNTCRNILSWCDMINGGVGYITRYAIGSARSTSGWGSMYLAVGNNDTGSKVGCAVYIEGNGRMKIEGDLVVKGNVLAEGEVTAYAAEGSEGELKSYFLTTSLEKQNLNADTLNASNMVYYPSSDMNTWTDTTFTNFPTSKPAGGFMLMVLKEGSYLRQIYSSYKDSHLYQRYQYFSGGKKWSGWLKIANSSDKFDSIDFSTGSTIKAPSDYNFIGFYKGTDVQKIAAGGIYVGASYANTNNVPVGSVYATEFKQTSDIRKKNKLNDIIIPTDKIALAPIFRFSWKDTNKIDVGSSAQYWKEVLPDLVSELEEGTLSMNYSNIALTCVVSLAKQMQNTIKELNERIKKLEQLNN